MSASFFNRASLLICNMVFDIVFMISVFPRLLIRAGGNLLPSSCPVGISTHGLPPLSKSLCCGVLAEYVFIALYAHNYIY